MLMENGPLKKNNNEYEVIEHKIIKNFKVFLVSLAYRTPHVHSDFEFNFLLEGSAFVICDGIEKTFHAPDYFVVNPFTPHEIRTESPALFLSIQVQTSFFKSYFPAVSHTEFAFCGAPNDPAPIFSYAVSLAKQYFKEEPGFELFCAARLNDIFYYLITSMPHQTVSNAVHQKQKQNYKRIRRISDYIDEHYSEKLLLRDVAEIEGLSLTYLSHFFKDHFQMSFQEYLMRLRCEKARQLLLLTDHNLLEICLECGFSDIKYLNKGFLEIYKTSPKELRRQSPKKEISSGKSFLQSTQRFLSAEDSLKILEESSLTGFCVSCPKTYAKEFSPASDIYREK